MERFERILAVILFVCLTTGSSLFISSCEEPMGGYLPQTSNQNAQQTPALPLDERSYQLLGKLAQKYPDTIFKGGVNFKEWIHIDTILPVLQNIEPPVTISLICFRPTGINLGGCANDFTATTTSDPNLKEKIFEAAKFEAALYYMTTKDSKFYDEEVLKKYGQCDLELYAVILDTTPNALLQLWDNLPEIRMINPSDAAESGLLAPIIAFPETELKYIK